MKRGKNRTLGDGSRGSRKKKIKSVPKNMDMTVIKTEDLDIDTISSTERVGMFGQMVWVPEITFVVNGRCVKVIGKKNVGKCLSDLLGRNVSGGEVDEITRTAKWEDIVSSYKKEMSNKGIGYVKFQINNDFYHPRIYKISGLKREHINSATVLDFVVNRFKEVDGIREGKDAIFISNEVSSRVNKLFDIKGGYNISQGEDDAILVKPFVKVGSSKIDFGTKKMFPSETWKDDVGDIIVGDVCLIEDIVDNAYINSNIPLKMDDKKFDVLKRRLYNALSGEGSGEVVIPRVVKDELINRFCDNINRFCYEGEFSGRAVCVDVALNNAISPENFPVEIRDKLKKVLVDFVKGVSK